MVGLYLVHCALCVEYLPLIGRLRTEKYARTPITAYPC